jgi:hypothetical protein
MSTVAEPTSIENVLAKAILLNWRNEPIDLLHRVPQDYEAKLAMLNLTNDNVFSWFIEFLEPRRYKVREHLELLERITSMMFSEIRILAFSINKKIRDLLMPHLDEIKKMYNFLRLKCCEHDQYIHTRDLIFRAKFPTPFAKLVKQKKNFVENKLF